MAQYKAKPIIVNAVQVTRTLNREDLRKFADLSGNYSEAAFPFAITSAGVRIETGQYPHPVSIGDWIVRTSTGEFIPMRADTFASTYEFVKE